MSLLLPGIIAGVGVPAVHQTTEGLQLQLRITENLQRISSHIAMLTDHKHELEDRAKKILDGVSPTLLHRNQSQIQTDVELLQSFQRQVTALKNPNQPSDFQSTLRGQPSVEKPEDTLTRAEECLDRLSKKHAQIIISP